MITPLTTYSQSAPYQQVANTTGVNAVVSDGGVTDRPGVDKPTTDRPGTTTGKSTSDRPGAATGTDRTSGTGSQTQVAINAGTSSKGWIWAIVIIAVAVIGFVTWYYIKRKK